ncbi:MAG: STAS domain-containing protein [Phycisphaerales bacterium]|jgi:anti-sigma B factor antagonist|nr:STAS domain-containing protein [Phycisphaerales bacterium]NUQ67738.1 STAS domain-containing protein [Phycisphaerales bacterium]
MNDRTPLKVTTSDHDGARVLHPQGEIGYQEAPEFRTFVRAAFDAKPRAVVVDLGGVAYMGTPGVATLVEGLQISKRVGIPLVVAAMNDRVRAIFEIARLHTVFKIAASVDEAVKP